MIKVLIDKEFVMSKNHPQVLQTQGEFFKLHKTKFMVISEYYKDFNCLPKISQGIA